MVPSSTGGAASASTVSSTSSGETTGTASDGKTAEKTHRHLIDVIRQKDTAALIAVTF